LTASTSHVVKLPVAGNVIGCEMPFDDSTPVREVVPLRRIADVERLHVTAAAVDVIELVKPAAGRKN
jgi:hypothetical protein